MKRIVGLAFILLVHFSSGLNAQSANEIISSVIEAMGGLEKWQNIAQISMNHAGHKYWLEQSENPNGPFITSYDVTEEIRGVWSPLLSKKESTRHFQTKEASSSEIIVNGPTGLMRFGERTFPLPYQLKIQHDEWIRYAPEYLIFKASNRLVELVGEKQLEGTAHFVLSYELDKLKHTLFINKHTRLLTQAQIETYQPYDVFNYPWGKFTTTIKFSLQWLYPNNIRYPGQWDVYKLGKHYRSITIFDIQFDSEIGQKTFEVPADLPQSPPPVSVNDTPLKTADIIQVAENIYTIPGSWYVAHIVHEDGIIAIEAPISSGYSQRHIEFLKKTYPNKPIKAVIASSDAWPHLGGIREFAAHGVPIYTQKLNKEIINKILSSDHSPNPDAFQKSPKPANLNLVNEKVRINDPFSPVELIPVNGEGGERMIMAYFPKQKVLYASDLIQFTGRKKEKFFAPQYLSEVKNIVDQYALDVKTVFAMHTSPIPWQQVVTALKNNDQ